MRRTLILLAWMVAGCDDTPEERRFRAIREQLVRQLHGERLGETMRPFYRLQCEAPDVREHPAAAALRETCEAEGLAQY